MAIAIQKMLAQLLFWIYQLLDIIFDMFQVLCGIQNVSVEGEDGSKSLINVFLESSAVTKAFLLIMLVAVAVAGLSTIASVVKNIVNLKGGERKSHTKTVGQAFGSIIISLTMAVIMITCISLSGTVLNSIAKATSNNADTTFSNQLFAMSVEDTYEYEYVIVYEYVLDENGEPMKDENDDFIKQVKIDANGDVVYEKSYKLDDNQEKIVISGWKKGEQQELDFSSMSPDDIFGVREKNLIGLEKDDSKYKSDPIVYLDSFNFLTAYIVAIVMIVSFVFCMLGLVKRILDIVMLFITLPLISATIPLDDGARFKSWRDTVVSKVVLSYGAVLSVNVYLLIMPIINNLQFDELGWNTLLSSLFKIFLMIGGALSINGGQLLVSRLMGTSAEESREMAHSARALLGGMGAVGGAMRVAKNLLGGGTNKYGRQRTGMLNFAARLGNAIGEKAGGDKFKNSFGGKAMRWAGRMPQLQKQDATMGNMANNVKSIADVLTGGNGNNGAMAGLQQPNSQANNAAGASQASASPASGMGGLVGNVLSNGANNNNGASNNAFSRPDSKPNSTPDNK